MVKYLPLIFHYIITDYWLRWGEDFTSLLPSLFLRGLRWGSSISFDARNEVRSSIFLWGWGKKSFLTLPQLKHEKCWKIFNFFSIFRAWIEEKWGMTFFLNLTKKLRTSPHSLHQKKLRILTSNLAKKVRWGVRWGPHLTSVNSLHIYDS